MSIRRFTLSGILILALLAGCKKSESPTASLDYNTIGTIQYTAHIQSLFNRGCTTSGCHNATTKAAGLSLISWNDLIRGSSRGEVIVPFSSTKSLLPMLFDGTPLRRQHPATGSGFSTSEMNVLKRWIDEGAKNDAGTVPYEHSMNALYVPNQAEDNVAIIDVDSLVVRRYVNVGNSPTIDGPHYVVANEHAWYVSLIGVQQVWKFDAHADTVLGKTVVQGSPALLELTPDGSKLYVSQFMSSSTKKVVVINTSTMTVVRTIDVWNMPHGMRMNRAGTRLFVANMMSDNISVIDVGTDSVIETISLAYDARPFGPAKYLPMEIALSPNDSIMLVTCSEQQEVRMFNAVTFALIDSFSVGDQPWHLQFTPNGEYCYVSNRRGNTVSVIHMPMRHVMETIVSAGTFDYPHGCDVSQNGRYAFISNENVGHGFVPRYNTEYVGNVSVIDLTLNQVVKVLEVGKMPTGLTIAR